MDAPDLREMVARAINSADNEWADAPRTMPHEAWPQHVADAVLAVPAIADALREAVYASPEARWKRGKVSEIQADAVWMAKLARGSSWPGEMAQRVQAASDRVIQAYGTDADRAALDAIAALYPETGKGEA